MSWQQLAEIFKLLREGQTYKPHKQHQKHCHHDTHLIHLHTVFEKTFTLIEASHSDNGDSCQGLPEIQDLDRRYQWSGQGQVKVFIISALQTVFIPLLRCCSHHDHPQICQVCFPSCIPNPYVILVDPGLTALGSQWVKLLQHHKWAFLHLRSLNPLCQNRQA